ncbi:hypothetical protein B1218_37085, partial [Pseudomonas ogarae]
MNKIRLYIYSAIFGFVIVLLFREPTVIAIGLHTNKLTLLAEITHEITSLSFANSTQELVPELFEARNSEYGIIF